MPSDMPMYGAPPPFVVPGYLDPDFFSVNQSSNTSGSHEFRTPPSGDEHSLPVSPSPADTPPFSAFDDTTQNQSLYPTTFGGGIQEFTGQFLHDGSNYTPAAANVFQPTDGRIDFGLDGNTHFGTTNANSIYDQQFQFPSGQQLPAPSPGSFQPPCPDRAASVALPYGPALRDQATYS